MDNDREKSPAEATVNLIDSAERSVLSTYIAIPPASKRSNDEASTRSFIISGAHIRPDVILTAFHQPKTSQKKPTVMMPPPSFTRRTSSSSAAILIGTLQGFRTGKILEAFQGCEFPPAASIRPGQNCRRSPFPTRVRPAKNDLRLRSCPLSRGKGSNSPPPRNFSAGS